MKEAMRTIGPTHILALPNPFVVSNVVRELWSVHIVKCLPQRDVLHFSVAHMHPSASFSPVEYFLCDSVSVQDANAIVFSVLST